MALFLNNEPSNRRRELLAAFTFLASFLCIAGIFIKHYIQRARAANKQQEMETQQSASRFNEIRNGLKRFTTVNSANDSWMSDLCVNGRNTRVFTADIQRVLRRSDGRPALILAELNDVKQDSMSYGLTATSYVCDGSEMHLELTASQDTIDKISQNKGENQPVYAFAIQPERFDRTHTSSDGESSSGGAFIVGGRCIDSFYLGAEGYHMLLENLRGPLGSVQAAPVVP